MGVPFIDCDVFYTNVGIMIEVDKPPALKPLYWVGSSKRDLRSLPGAVEDLFG
jgi:hypothetical protein